MSNHRNLGDLVKERLEKDFVLAPLDTGTDARLSKKGMMFTTESYDIGGIAHLCILSMRAMMGLMKMETAVISSYGKDVPLINLDWVSAFGNETQMAELYNDQLEPYPQELLDEFEEIKEADADLPDYPSSPAWYDSIIYPCSYRKRGKKISDRLSAAAERYTDVFCCQLKDAPECDPSAKTSKVSEFASRLFTEGGPAVSQVRKLFGDEIARRLILTHMYGVK